MDFQNDISLIIAIEHRNNFQNWGGRWGRRTKFMRHLKTVLEELDVGYRMPLQPVSFHPASAAVFQNLNLGQQGNWGSNSDLSGGNNNLAAPPRGGNGGLGRPGPLGMAPPAPSARIGRTY